MASALSPLLLPPPAPVPRPVALRPVSASDAGARSGRGPDIDPEVLREDELQRLYGPDLGRHSTEGGTQARHSAADETDELPEPAAPPLGIRGNDSAFLTQLMAQEESEEQMADPFGDASRAYERFREERQVGMVVDVRDPVDVSV